jgi:hypothetical protein
LHVARRTSHVARCTSFLVRLVILVLAALLASPACGKRGPPLAPLIRVPARVADLTVRQIASAVYLEFRVPTENQDGSMPIDLARIEVYGLTTAPDPRRNPPQDARAFMKVANLVARVEIAEPPEAGAPPQAPEAVVRHSPGETATTVEQLTPDVLIPIDPRPASSRRDREPMVELGDVVPGLSVGLDPPNRRTYLIIGISRRGRLGDAVRTEVPLVSVPAPPGAPAIDYTEANATMTWQPPPTARRFVQEPVVEDGGRIPSRPIIEWPGPWRYEVYEVAPEAADEQPALPRPLNTEALSDTEYADPRVNFGVERCYAVRSVATFRNLSVRSAASPSTCVTFVDTFPPSVPQGLTAVATEDAVNLIWEPSPEGDVAGYLVLRARLADETLQPLTFEPIAGTTYRDTSVEAGVRYRYAVQALDRAAAPNMSEPSEPFEIIAR